MFPMCGLFTSSYSQDGGDIGRSNVKHFFKRTSVRRCALLPTWRSPACTLAGRCSGSSWTSPPLRRTGPAHDVTVFVITSFTRLPDHTVQFTVHIAHIVFTDGLHHLYRRRKSGRTHDVTEFVTKRFTFETDQINHCIDHTHNSHESASSAPGTSFHGAELQELNVKCIFSDVRVVVVLSCLCPGL